MGHLEGASAGLAAAYAHWELLPAARKQRWLGCTR